MQKVHRENVQIKMDNIFWWSINRFHSRMWNLAQLSNPLFSSRSNVSRDNPAHAYNRDRWGKMASFCLLILEEKRNWENEFPRLIWSMFCVLHSSWTTTAKNTRFHKLEMYPVWPNWGLMLADNDFVFLFDRRMHSIRVCGGKCTKMSGRGQNWTGKICWYSHPENSKVYPIHCTRIHCQENIYIFNCEHIWRKTPKIWNPNVNLHRRIGTIRLPKWEILSLVDVLLAKNCLSCYRWHDLCYRFIIKLLNWLELCMFCLGQLIVDA
jgi:hypothetical protein